METVEALIEFKFTDKSVKELIFEDFSEFELVEGNSFSGVDYVLVIVMANVSVIGLALKLFQANRTRFREATIKVANSEIEIHGYSPDELQRLIDSGNLSELMDQLKG